MVMACAVVGIILGLITAIMGITSAASAAQSLVIRKKWEDHSLSLSVWCEYQGSPAVGCGVMAALLALTTQIVATIATGCCGCCRTWGIPSEAKLIVAVVLSTISWVLAIIVVILFIVGAVASRDRELPTNAVGICVPPGTGVFVAATILFLISMFCQITSYVLLQATVVAGSTKPSLAQESGITMGQPAAAEPANNSGQKAAAVGDLPPSAPTAAAAGDLPPSAPTAAAAGDLPPSAPTAAAAGDLPPSAPTAAAAGELPPSVPTASSEAKVDTPPPLVPTMSPKASAEC
ncbi:hypothetical protein D1007_30442 [Hordeum vulgare]|nr:hypothetical protein D1007_30442 [Hordeum vulgare]